MDRSVITLPNEQALASRAKAEPEAFAEIYDHYFPLVYNYVRYRVSDGQSADDITARIFEKALTGINRYRPNKGSLGSWLFGIARYTVADHLRAEKRRRWLSLEILSGRANPDPAPEQVALRGERQAQLLAAVARLSDRERELIAFKFGARLSNRNIASVTGLSESNVGVILYRALRRLRKMLAAAEQVYEPKRMD